MPKDIGSILGVKQSATTPSSASWGAGLDSEYGELQKAANYRSFGKTLRPSGIASIVFGLIAVVMGIAMIEDNPVNGVLVVIGLLLAVEGVWLVSAPSPGGLIADGIALIVLGIWNLVVTVMSASAAGGSGFGVLGAFQIIWGFQRFGRYGRVTKIAMVKPSPEVHRRLEQITGEVVQAKAIGDPRYVEFQGKTSKRSDTWQGLLGDARAVFVRAGGSDYVFASREGVDLREVQTVHAGQTLKASFRLGDRAFSGTISPESFERYERWKKALKYGAMPPAAPPDATMGPVITAPSAQPYAAPTETSGKATTNSAARIFGALFRPKATFESIAQRPTWLAPVLLSLAVSIAATLAVGQHVGWRNVVTKQIESNPRAQKQMEKLSADQRDQVIDQQAKVAPIFGYVIAVVAPFLIPVVIGAICLGVLNLVAGANTNFKASLSIVAYGFLPWAIHGLLTILIIFLKDPSTIDVQNAVASNAGAFLSDEAPKWLVSLLGSLDIFSFWTMALMAMGFSAINPKKISIGKGFGLVLAVWLFWVIVKVGLAAAFS